ncbi:MAG: D-alanyl-D-alanine carboxypeptidase family protein [Salaquimonas sp.]
MNPRLSSLFLFLLIFALQASFARADVLGPNLTFNINTGKVYSQKNPFDQWYPASITKMMTAYTVFREIKRGHIAMNSPVRVSPISLAKPPSKMGFPVGTILTIEAGLKIILVKSANDIAAAVAESVGGSEEEFANLMNEYAADIGMKSSHFVNAHGLHDPEQYTTAYDLGILARQIYREFPEYSKLFGIHGIKVGKRNYRNHNALMRVYPGTIGMKTGFICAGGLSLVTSSKYNGEIIVSVILGGRTGNDRNVLAAELQTVAAKRVETDSLVDFDTLKPWRKPLPPVDVSEQVCKKKGRASATLMYDDEAIEYFAIQNISLEERKERYFSTNPVSSDVELVELGGANGPDPYELLVEKPPINLTEEFAEGSEGDEPLERFELENGIVVALPIWRPLAQYSP